MENTNKQLTMSLRDDVGGEAEMTFKNITPKMIEDFEAMGAEAPYAMSAQKGDDGKWRVEIRTKDGKSYTEDVENDDTPNTEEGAKSLIQQMKRYILSYNSEPEPEMTDGEQRCCLCEKMFVGWGHNPKPLPFARVAKGDAFTSHRCCDECNLKLVIPVRKRLSLAGKFKLGCADVRSVIITRVAFGEGKAYRIVRTDDTIVPYFYINPETNLQIGTTLLIGDNGKIEEISCVPTRSSVLDFVETKLQQIRQQKQEQEEQRKAKKAAEKAKEERRKIKEAQRQEEEAERRRIENDMIAKRKEESARLEAEYNAAKQREFEERLKALERREAQKKEEEKRDKEQKAKEAEERKAKKEAEKAEKQKQFQSKRK